MDKLALDKLSDLLSHLLNDPIGKIKVGVSKERLRDLSERTVKITRKLDGCELVGVALKLGELGCISNGDGIGSVILLRNVHDTCDVVLGCKLIDRRDVLNLLHNLLNDSLRNNRAVIALCKIGLCSVLDTCYGISDVIRERLIISLLNGYFLLSFGVFHSVSSFLSFNGFVNVVDFCFDFIEFGDFFACHSSLFGFCAVKKCLKLTLKVVSLFFKTLNIHSFSPFIFNNFHCSGLL